MPAEIEAPVGGATPSRPPRARGAAADTIVGLVNNMPDSALESTEAQFSGLLAAACGAQPVRVRLSSFPETPRGYEAREHIAHRYWPLADLLASGVDALIVTGTEPLAPRLADEPYWPRLVELLEFAEKHTVASIWSCLAAHAVVERLHGIQRRRLDQKRCGVFAHRMFEGHPLLAGVSPPLYMPHSRWNDLPVGELRAAGYQILSWSDESGADSFVRHERSLMLFFQGHPEYQDTTLLKEYRRDSARYLSGEQAHYPTLPDGYLSAEAIAVLEAYRERALAGPAGTFAERFPFLAASAGLQNRWRPAAVAIYRNWLEFIAAARTPAAETVSFARV